MIATIPSIGLIPPTPPHSTDSNLDGLSPTAFIPFYVFGRCCCRFLKGFLLGPMPYLLFTNRFDVRKISANGRDSKLLAISRSASALAVHYAEKMMYWADNGLQTISRTLVNGTGKPEVIIRNVQKPDALSLDWLGNKLYWTDLCKLCVLLYIPLPQSHRTAHKNGSEV